MRHVFWSLARAGLPLLVTAVLLLAWEAAVAQVHVRSPAVPAPSTILRTAFTERDILLRSAEPTLTEAAIGFLLGNLVALVLAAIVVRWPALEASIVQVSVTVHALPVIAVAPLLVVWLGTGYAPRVVLAAVACFFPTLVNATRGFNAVDQSTTELLELLGASRLQVFLKARIPSSVPYLFASFKIGAPAAVLGAVLGEWIGAEQGVGLVMLYAMFTHLVPRVWATVLLTALLAGLAYLLLAVLERLLVPWAREVSTT